MVQQVGPMAIRTIQDGQVWYRCNRCFDKFGYVDHYANYKHSYVIPRFCPNCRAEFKNGLRPVELDLFGND